MLRKIFGNFTKVAIGVLNHSNAQTYYYSSTKGTKGGKSTGKSFSKYLKVHKNEIFLALILNFVLFHVWFAEILRFCKQKFFRSGGEMIILLFLRLS